MRGGIGHTGTSTLRARAGCDPDEWHRNHAADDASTRTVPIVFVNVTDPVGAGFVESLARPGRNATGFVNFQHGIASKWLELLKEISPPVTRVAVLRDLAIAAGIGQWTAIQSVRSRSEWT